MRSLAFTCVLAGLAAVFGGLSVWQWRQGSFDAWFGAPPTPVGGMLYDSFKPDAVRHIRIAGNGANAVFSLESSGWQASAPWVDRMDPRAAVAIIHFTLGMRVEDLAPVEKVDAKESGLDANSVEIRLEDGERRPLAHYRLGRMSPWKATVEGMEAPVGTVFVQLRDRHRKQQVYLCTGDINPLFKDGLRFLRDHRPFYFNPATTAKIRIRSPQGDLALGRANAKAPWRIVSPLDLPTDPAAIKTLLEGLFELRAATLEDRSAVTLPSSADPVSTRQIAITPFGSEVETVLDIYPPESPDDKEVKATVSDRPTTVFDLPVKPEAGLVTLANLPMQVNELRDPTLTRLNIASLRGISIQPSTSSPVVITREPPKPWQVTVDGVEREASEENLFVLLKAVTTGRATAFASDAATDFTPWGLDRPFLRLHFLGQDNQGLELRFGMDKRGDVFVNRLGSPTVMQVDPALTESIPVRPYEWRHSRVWSLDRSNLLAIERSAAGTAPLVLEYDNAYESWEATREGADASATVDPAKASIMLAALEGLKASKWLAAGDADALAALSAPSLVFKVRERVFDDHGAFTGFSDRVLALAPAGGSRSGFHYGRLNTDPQLFLIDRETFRKLSLKPTD